jgi:osmotically-inducible protein OsmY
MAWTMQRDRYYYRADDLPADELPTDRELKTTVVHRLRENPYTQDARIKVSVADGVVRLGGRVPTPEAKAIAADDAWSVPGVFDVANGLEIRRAA